MSAIPERKGKTTTWTGRSKGGLTPAQQTPGVRGPTHELDALLCQHTGRMASVPRQVQVATKAVRYHLRLGALDARRQGVRRKPRKHDGVHCTDASTG